MARHEAIEQADLEENQGWSQRMISHILGENSLVKQPDPWWFLVKINLFFTNFAMGAVASEIWMK